MKYTICCGFTVWPFVWSARRRTGLRFVSRFVLVTVCAAADDKAGALRAGEKLSQQRRPGPPTTLVQSATRCKRPVAGGCSWSDATQKRSTVQKPTDAKTFVRGLLSLSISCAGCGPVKEEGSDRRQVVKVRYPFLMKLMIMMMRMMRMMMMKTIQSV